MVLGDAQSVQRYQDMVHIASWLWWFHKVESRFVVAKLHSCMALAFIVGTCDYTIQDGDILSLVFDT